MVAFADERTRFIGHLLEERRLSEHTARAYRADLNELATFVAESLGAETSIEVVDTRLLRRYLSLRSRSLSPRSLARKLASMRAFFRYLRRRGRLQVDPTAGLRSPKVKPRLPVFVNPDQAARLVESPTGDDPSSLRDRAILETFYAGGLRLSELRGLDLHDRSSQGDCLLIRVVGKGNKERQVILGAEATAAIERYLVARPRLLRPKSDSDALGALFLSTRGRRISLRSIQNLVKRAGQVALGRADLHPHALRHTCATHMLDGGADLRSIQEFLGHGSLSVTQKYTHTSIDKLIQVYDRAHPLASAALDRKQILPDD